MQHEVTYSLIEHLRKEIGVNAYWIYDGVVLPDDTQKPYITVEQLQNDNDVLSKNREAVRTIMRYQVGLFAKTASERARKQDEIRETLMFDSIYLLDTTTNPPPVVGEIIALVTAETPISPENIADKSKYHRVYFDVEVPVVRNRRKQN